MAPETRSRGTAPPRVYHSSPALQQAQFPPRRKVVRTYGKHRASTATPSSSSSSARVPPPSSARFSSSARDPRQKTLTQIDFVSSSMMSEAANAVVLSDSDEDDIATAEDKENERPEDEEDEDEEEPVQAGRKKRRAKAAKGKDVRGKRRRTLGDENEFQQTATEKTKKKDEPRRRTLGDVPSSKYHTQTLTQFLGHENEALIKDSEDEEDGFDDWLQAPDSPSPRSKKLPPRGEKQSNDASASSKDLTVAPDGVSRQSSVVPQTPTKRPIRSEIPSSSQQSTPASHMLDRYGAPDEEKPSPSIKSGKSHKVEVVEELTGKPKRKLVIEDSFATESWGSSNRTPTKGTPLKDITEEATGVGGVEMESSSAMELMSTPTGPRRRKSLELGQATPTKASPANISAGTPKAKSFAKTHAGLVEIPDSDEEDEGFSENEEPLPIGDDSSDKENKTQTKPAKRVRIQSDVDKEKRESYLAGPETQFAMDVLESSDVNLSGQASSAPQQPQSKQTSTDPTDSSPELPPLKHPAKTTVPPSSKPKSKPIRRPRRHLPPASQTQPLESQRVAFATIKNFGQHSDRTDVLVVLPPSTIDPLVSGHEVDLHLPYKIPENVERFWLFDGEYIRYGACVEPAQQQGSQLWRYHVWQVYELNDPKDAEYIIAGENWFQAIPSRYNYVPPTGVSELMSNLRFALFGGEQETQDEEPAPPPPLPVSSARTTATGSSFSDSQQVEAQLQSDIAQHTQVHTSDAAAPDDAILVPSTPLKNRKKKSKVPDATPRDTTNTIRPSQATTVSQVSTPEKPQQPHATTHSSSERPPPLTGARRPPLSSSSIPTFQDTDGSSPSLMSNLDMSLRSSQLLTKSQMLSDSLLQDDAKVPPEIWDSD